jgi:hypothetical protein
MTGATLTGIKRSLGPKAELERRCSAKIQSLQSETLREQKNLEQVQGMTEESCSKNN